MRKRQQERKATQLARMIVALDAAACEQRPFRRRRITRAAVSSRA